MSKIFNPDDNEIVAVKMLEKIRAAFAIGNPLLLAGKADASMKVYMRVVNNLLAEDKRSCFNSVKIESLEQTVKLVKDSDDKEENAHILRTELESIYDEMIDKYCGLQGVSFDPIHKQISKCIRVCQPLDKSCRFKESALLYRRVAQDVILNASSLSKKAVNMLSSAVNSNEANGNWKEASSELKESLEYVYNEIRLPEVYRDEDNVENRQCNFQGQQLLLLGVTNKERKVEYNSIVITDSVLGGQSKAEFLSWDGNATYAKFQGVLSLENDGGFALVKLIPRDPSAFNASLKGSIGLFLSIKNAGKKTERIKILLSSAKGIQAFNWQCDFLLPVGEGNSEIYLPLANFWPSLFGHALANSGNVDLNEVDTVGVLISKLTQSGKPSPEFVEGNFCICLESIHLVKD